MLPRHSMLTIKNQAVKTGLVLAASLLFLAGCGPPGPRALLEGKKLLDSGKTQAAVEKCKLATLLMPTNALAFNYFGLACQEAGQWAEAERAYVRALALNREMAEVHFNLGCLFLAQNKLEQAKSEFTAFTLRRPTSPEGFLKLGTAQLRARESAAAERSFSEALRLTPNDPEALTGIGMVRFQRNRAADAVQYFNKALQQQPDYRPALLNLAIVAQETLHDRQLALINYKKLLALKPPPENAAAIMAIVQKLEEPPAAPVQPPTTANTLVQTPPAPSQTNVSARKNLAPGSSPGATPPRTEVAVSSSLPPTNLPSAKTLPQTNSSKPPLASDLAGSKQVSWEPAKAGSTTQVPLEVVTLSNEPEFKPGKEPAAVSSTPPKKGSPPLNAGPDVSTSNKVAKHGLFQKINPARLFAGQSSAPPITNTTANPERTPTSSPPTDTATKAAAFPRYTYKSPAKPSAGNRAQAERSYSQGVQAYQSQRLPEAMQAYRRAVQLDPTFFNAHYNLALVASELGNTETALVTYETALVLRPDFQEARYNFALLLKQLNYPLDAANELQKILENFPNDSRAHLALGNLYAQQLGNTNLARQHYLKVLESDPRNPQSAKIHYWLTEHPK